MTRLGNDDACQFFLFCLQEGLLVTQYHGSTSQVTYVDPASGLRFTVPQWAFVDLMFKGSFQWDHRWTDVAILVLGFISATWISIVLGLKFVRHELR